MRGFFNCVFQKSIINLVPFAPLYSYGVFNQFNKGVIPAMNNYKYGFFKEYFCGGFPLKRSNFCIKSFFSVFGICKSLNYLYEMVIFMALYD